MSRSTRPTTSPARHWRTQPKLDQRDGCHKRSQVGQAAEGANFASEVYEQAHSTTARLASRAPNFLSCGLPAAPLPNTLQGCAVNHCRTDAEAEQTPKPDARHWPLERDVECAVDDKCQRIAENENEKVSPSVITKPAGTDHVHQKRGAPTTKGKEPEGQTGNTSSSKHSKICVVRTPQCRSVWISNHEAVVCCQI